MKKIGFIVVITVFIIGSYSAAPITPVDADLCATGEKVIFSFKTTSSKTVSICAADDDSYIVYRFGTQNKIELEYPEDKTNSWEKFTFYHQNGDAGAMKEFGINWNGEYLFFNNGGYRYEIYFVKTWKEGGNIEERVGITVTHIITKNSSTIKGIPGSKKGDFSGLRHKLDG